MKYPPIQCLTLDGISMSHAEQVHALCLAGARWIQLRMKDASDAEAESVAAACLSICREVGCRLIINDRVELALRVGVDGVHLGSLDMPWAQARSLAGDDFIIGGTVNSVADAEAAVESGVLDYVGVGPYRFTSTKKNLAPVLSREDWGAIISVLGDLPAYAIGGIDAESMPDIRSLGVTGVALSSGMYRYADISGNYRQLIHAWRISKPGKVEIDL